MTTPDDVARQIAELGHIRSLRVAELEPDGSRPLVIALQRVIPMRARRLWRAITDPAQVGQWFQPLAGDLREGGTYVMNDGQESGAILACSPPRRLQITFGREASIVTIELVPEPDGGQTELRVEHRVSLDDGMSPSGAIFLGTAWDANLVLLTTWLTTGTPTDMMDPQLRPLFVALLDVWHDLIRDTGTVDPETLTTVLQSARMAFVDPPSDLRGMPT